MNSPRSRWFEAHLLADRAGRNARAACERLGEKAHEAILAVADRLALTSPAIAQQFYKQAAAAWQTLGPTDFGRWADLGSDLLGPAVGVRSAGPLLLRGASGHAFGSLQTAKSDTLLAREPVPHEAASAYFSVRPKVVARVGLGHLTVWCAIGKRVAALSRKLGALFFEQTAPLIDRLSVSALTEWARHGARLHGSAGWSGEFLAQAYFGAAATVLPVLESTEFGAWVDLGLALQRGNDYRFFAGLPDGLSGLKSEERALLFAAARQLADTDVAAGGALYTHLPAAVRQLPGSARLRLLQLFHAAGIVVTHAVTDIVKVAGALVQHIPKHDRLAALDLTLGVAHQFPRGSMALLRSLPRAYEEARHAVVQEWVARGLAIAADNAEAGVAYFGLESRTSFQVLQTSSTAANLGDVQGVLRKYGHMLSGRAVSIRAGERFTLRPPVEEFPLEDEVALPLKIDVFDTHEDNCRVYDFLAAQLAGRREFATYEPTTLPADANASLFEFLRAPQHPALLEEIFLVLEGLRIGAALARNYPGAATEHRRLAGELLARFARDPSPAQPLLFDGLLAWLLSDRDAARLPAWLGALARLVTPCAAPLARREATVDDSLAVAQALTATLAQVVDAGRSGPVIGDLHLDKVSGDALIDPGMGMDDDWPTSGEAPPLPMTATPPALPDDVQFQLGELQDDAGGQAVPLSPEELQRLIEAGADLHLKQGYRDDVEGLGLYITDLLGKLPAEELDMLRALIQESLRSDRPPPRRWLERRGEGASFYYDEWDYQIADYRQRWCRLREIAMAGDAGEFFSRTLADYAWLIPEVRRQFQRIRPEMYRTVKGLEDGEDFDLNAVVSARVDRRARRPPSSKLYVARTREERDVATLFLIDLSASTDEPLQRLPLPTPDDDTISGERPRPAARARRIIDVTKEALVIMAEALAEIGDAYAIYGFSGHGRNNVEFYLIKSFNEPLGTAVKGRIGALEPKRSTRMGTALRHATEKMANISARSRHIILLSDGFPQDFDYGQDRRSNIYGLRDTSAALREAETAGVLPFCITVDRAGHDYLREMCDGNRYMVIDDIAALPRELPKIYQRVVGTS